MSESDHWRNEQPDEHEMCTDVLAFAMDIKMASQMLSKYRRPTWAAHFRIDCALQQNLRGCREQRRRKNSDRCRPDNARLCVISRRKAEFTGPALLSIANSGQMVLKLHDKIESHSP
jgi:hypothetical protein